MWLSTIYKNVTCHIIIGSLNAKKTSYSHSPPTKKCSKLILCKFLFQLLNIGCFSLCRLLVTLFIECFLFDAHTFLILSRINSIHRPFNQGDWFWNSHYCFSGMSIWFFCNVFNNSHFPHNIYSWNFSCTIAISSIFIIGKLDWKIFWYSCNLVIYYFRNFSQKWV